MKDMKIKLIPIVIAGLLVACASTPKLDIGGADLSVTPAGVIENPAAVRNLSVAWGGVIISSKNLETVTQLEVLSYPLDDDFRPNKNAAPLQRFLVIQDGYLETANYAAGRSVTAVGYVDGTRKGSVGDSTYVYPVIKSSQVHLWPKRDPRSTEPQFRFGIGIGISN